MKVFWDIMSNEQPFCLNAAFAQLLYDEWKHPPSIKHCMNWSCTCAEHPVYILDTAVLLNQAVAWQPTHLPLQLSLQNSWWSSSVFSSFSWSRCWGRTDLQPGDKTLLAKPVKDLHSAGCHTWEFDGTRRRMTIHKRERAKWPPVRTLWK